MTHPFTKEELRKFILKAGDNTYAGGGKPVDNPQRPGFIELVYEEGNFSYRDSYTGHFRSRGMEVVRYKDQPVWASMYGGGMTEGNDKMAEQTFEFLKKAMSCDDERFDSFRGPHHFKEGEWEYSYQQDGGVLEFSGYEEIHYKNQPIFFHRIIGGIIDH